MSVLRAACFSALAVLVGGVRLEAGLEMEEMTKGGRCADAVEDAKSRSFAAWRRRRGKPDCRCSKDFVVDGEDEACGNGTFSEFKSGDLDGKGCECVEMNPCTDVMDNATQRNRAGWRKRLRQPECKCIDDHSLVGDDEACGDGTQTKFKSKTVKGKGCQCMLNKECPAVQVQPDFNLTDYVSARWYVQQQMEVAYLDVKDNYCVNAKYTVKARKSVLRYEITVDNSCRKKAVDGERKGAKLCAHVPDENEPAKLAVAPCWLPKAASGAYWILAFNHDEGYALISGGQPKISTPLGCRTGDGVNGAGLWIFTRVADPAPALVEKVRGIATDQGFDLSVLNQVAQEGCTGPGYDED